MSTSPRQPSPLPWMIGVPVLPEGEMDRFWCLTRNSNGKTWHRMLCYGNRHVMPLADGIEDPPDGVEPCGDDGDYYWTGWFETSCDQCETQWMFHDEVVAWMELPRHGQPEQHAPTHSREKRLEAALKEATALLKDAGRVCDWDEQSASYEEWNEWVERRNKFFIEAALRPGE